LYFSLLSIQDRDCPQKLEAMAMQTFDDVYPMKRIPPVTATPLQEDREPVSEHKYARDEIELARFGKKQQLKVCWIFFLLRAGP
jgi:hypothetical protein